MLIQTKIKQFIYLTFLLICGNSKATVLEGVSRVHYFEVEVDGRKFIVAPSAHDVIDLAFPKKYGTEIARRIMTSSGVCFEANSQKTLEELAWNPKVKKMLLDENNSMNRYFPDDATSEILLKQLELKSEEKILYLNNLTPFKFQSDVISNSVGSEFKYGRSALDVFFHNIANSVSVKTDYLESPEEGARQIIETFDNVEGWKKSFVELAKFVNCEPCKIEYQIQGREFLKQIFYEGDFFSAKKSFDIYMKLTGQNYPLGEAIGDKRSEYLTEKIIQKFKERKCDVFLIGGAHFFGEKALQIGFGNRGYLIKGYLVD